jgi:hypothetical protein
MSVLDVKKVSSALILTLARLYLQLHCQVEKPSTGGEADYSWCQLQIICFSVCLMLWTQTFSLVDLDPTFKLDMNPDPTI